MRAALPSPAPDGTIRTASGVTYVPFVSGADAGYRVWFEGKMLGSISLMPDQEWFPALSVTKQQVGVIYPVILGATGKDTDAGSLWAVTKYGIV